MGIRHDVAVTADDHARSAIGTVLDDILRRTRGINAPRDDLDNGSIRQRLSPAPRC